MKRNLFYMTVITAFFSAAFVACTPDISTLPMGVSLDLSSLTLAPGESLKLTADVMPEQATIKTLIWNSDNPDVATVTDGVVTAIAEGMATISVITKSGQKMAACVLKVAYPVDAVTLDKSIAILTVGQSQRLTANVIPNDAPDISVNWESNNPDIVEVIDGVITGKAFGTATVTVTTKVGSRVTTCTVRVISDKYIFMTPSLSFGGVNFMVTGNGSIDINWGDNSDVETLTLSESPMSCYHNYSGIPPYAITIEGEDVKSLVCPRNQLTSLYLCNMTELISINCANNGLTSLDVNGCAALEELICNNNLLTNLDVSKNTMLKELHCYYNQLTSLDVSNNTALSSLDFFNNPLTSMNVSNTRLKSLNVSGFLMIEHLFVGNNVELTDLNCSNNVVKSLDVSDNTALQTLNCSNNQLTNLDVSNNIELTSLDCSINRITSLNVGNNIALASLNCSYNQLTNLGVGNNGMLGNLDCQFNQLSTEALNDLLETLHENAISGGKTVQILGNPGAFTCEQSIAEDKGWEVFVGNYMTMTLQPYSGVYISATGSGTMVIDWGDGSTENYSLLQYSWNSYYHYYSATLPCTVMIVGHITGLNVNNLFLTSLDVSKNTMLKELHCIYNQLTSLDVNKNTNLENLYCSYNQLTSLYLTENNQLSYLDCSNNRLTSLDLSNNTKLVSLECSYNQLSVEALNALFGTLHNNYNWEYKWIYINNNPGTDACNQSIATGKGWIVY